MADTTHDSSGGSGADPGAAVRALYDLTLHLRRACPWDRAQSGSTIVPHTLEEAYEVADVVRAYEAGTLDDPRVVEDELGDLLFQICFLTMLLEERDPRIHLGTVAQRIHEKLVRRHPHVFGEGVQADTADDVRGAWEQVKRITEQRGLFDGIPGAMPALSQAAKVQARAASVGFDFPEMEAALNAADAEVAELWEAVNTARAEGTMPDGESAPPDVAVEHEFGDVLFAVVNAARLARVDPELALRGASTRFQTRVETAQQLAGESGEEWSALDADGQEAWYQRAKEQLAKDL